MRLPARPSIYEINTATFLSDLSHQLKRPVDLASIPAAEWDRLASLSFNAVWLMGVWRRSPAGLPLAKHNPELAATLPDLQESDIIGSAYSIQDYVVNPAFGGEQALAVARAELAARGIGLILDYVPNHVALDHPWVSQHPDYFIQGTERELAKDPEAFWLAGEVVLAKGRDPNFPPWSDVLQLNAFSDGLRQAAAATLLAIGSQCDGVRCDMAMLMMNDIFAKTWGKRAGVQPKEDYWPIIIRAIRQQYPNFLFMAEVYWDRERRLIDQGFDLCYDKKLYDLLVAGSVVNVTKYLKADRDYQQHLLRFIENHDEPRAAKLFIPSRERALAVATSTLEGARLYHNGQLEGRRIRVPVQLDRQPHEPVNLELNSFYERLLGAITASGLRAGSWQLCSCLSPTRRPSRQVVAWRWSGTSSSHLIIVNLSGQSTAITVRFTEAGAADESWAWRDLLNQQPYSGWQFTLKPWQFYLLERQS